MLLLNSNNGETKSSLTVSKEDARSCSFLRYNEDQNPKSPRIDMKGIMGDDYVGRSVKCISRVTSKFQHVTIIHFMEEILLKEIS